MAVVEFAGKSSDPLLVNLTTCTALGSLDFMMLFTKTIWKNLGFYVAAAILMRSLAMADVGITDARTPPEIGAGVPSSSYAESNIDSVDPYSERCTFTFRY